MTNEEKSLLQKKILDSLSTNPHGRLLLSPRIGKSKLIIDIIKRDKPKSILWVTSSVKLAKEDIPNEFDEWGANEYLLNLTTITWMSLNKIKGYYDMIVLDEDQYITANNYINLYNRDFLNGKYIISMTGTPTKSKVKKKLYKNLNLKTLYTLTINEAVDLGLLANYSLKVITVPLDRTKNYKAGSKAKPFLTSEYSNYQYLNRTFFKVIEEGKNASYIIRNRMRAIYDSPSKAVVVRKLVNKLEGRKMTFVPSIALAESLCEYTYHSKTTDEDLVKFQNGEINEIALVKTGGIGATYKRIEHLVVSQFTKDENGDTSQKICRTLMEQGEYKAQVWTVCLLGTKDEEWLEAVIQNFDKSKVEYIKNEEL